MRSELKELLDSELSRRRRNWLLGLLAILCPLLMYGFIFFPVSSTTIQGESISLTAIQTDYGSLPRMRVKLDGGRVVRATMSRPQPFVSGVRVKLEQRKTILGLRRYRVLSYVDENDN